MDIEKIKDDAIKTATKHIQDQRQINKYDKLKLYCVTVILCTLIVCASIVSCYAIYTQQQTIIEQQYALNMQYAQLTDLLSGAEIVTETTQAESGDDGIAIAGDGNMISGGDMNGDS